MVDLTSHPLLVFVFTIALLWASSWIGAAVLRRRRPLAENTREDFNVIVAASLTLLGLIIGFSFSMSISRYDQRKNLEEDEANAIGTEYLRADLLPGADAAEVKSLLRDYLEQRVAFYTVTEPERLRQVNARTSQLQNELWSAVRAPALAQPSPVAALAVAGMNDVLNSEGYSQAAWWNRIPTAAWSLMVAIAIVSNLLVGYGARRFKATNALMMVLPLIFAIAFLLIADIDSPRGGIIRVAPRNLTNVLESLGPK
jgi:hypothetical protein